MAYRGQIFREWMKFAYIYIYIYTHTHKVTHRYMYTGVSVAFRVLSGDGFRRYWAQCMHIHICTNIRTQLLGISVSDMDINNIKPTMAFMLALCLHTSHHRYTHIHMHTGVSVNVGDINGDGYGDIVLGAFASGGLSNTVQATGEVYVIFGKDMCLSVCIHTHTYVFMHVCMCEWRPEQDSASDRRSVCDIW